MPNGFGRGRGFGRGYGRSMGFGFRGFSPPWPYVGIGRGGLPRHAYFLSGAGAAAPWSYPQTSYYGVSPTYRYKTPAGSITREEELGYLKEQAEVIKGQLEQIDSRMRDMESQQ